jgi:hypothetical protein
MSSAARPLTFLVDGEAMQHRNAGSDAVWQPPGPEIYQANLNDISRYAAGATIMVRTD